MDCLRKTLDCVFNERQISDEKFTELTNTFVENKYGGYDVNIKKFHRSKILVLYSKSNLAWSEFELALSVLSPEPDSFTINVDVEFKPQYEQDILGLSAMLDGNQSSKQSRLPTCVEDVPDGSSLESRIGLSFTAAVQVYSDVLIMEKMVKSRMDMDQAAAWYNRIKDWDDEVAGFIQTTMEQAPLWTNRFPSEHNKPEPLWVKLVPDDTKEIHIPYANELTVRSPRPNPIREQWEKHGDLDANRPGTDVDLKQLFDSQTSDDASAGRRAQLRTKHFGVTPRAEGQVERETPNRTTGESEVNHDGYMTGDDEFRRIDPKKFAEE